MRWTRLSAWVVPSGDRKARAHLRAPVGPRRTSPRCDRGPGGSGAGARDGAGAREQRATAGCGTGTRWRGSELLDEDGRPRRGIDQVVGMVHAEGGPACRGAPRGAADRKPREREPDPEARRMPQRGVETARGLSVLAHAGLAYHAGSGRMPAGDASRIEVGGRRRSPGGLPGTDRCSGRGSSSARGAAPDSYGSPGPRPPAPGRACPMTSSARAGRSRRPPEDRRLERVAVRVRHPEEGLGGTEPATPIANVDETFPPRAFRT
jgi:hypothetical protein